MTQLWHSHGSWLELRKDCGQRRIEWGFWGGIRVKQGIERRWDGIVRDLPPFLASTPLRYPQILRWNCNLEWSLQGCKPFQAKNQRGKLNITQRHWMMHWTGSQEPQLLVMTQPPEPLGKGLLRIEWFHSCQNTLNILGALQTWCQGFFY